MMFGRLLTDARSMMPGAMAGAKKLGSRKAIAASRGGQFVKRHPYGTAALAMGPGYGMVSFSRNRPGAQRSRRNQNDYYLRRVRSGQQSNLLARSMGGMTG